MTSERSRTAHSESADQLARRALDALRGAGGACVAAAHLDAVEDESDRPVALGAVRVLGADVLAPYVLTGQDIPAEERDALELALSALPPVRTPPAAPPAGPAPAWVTAWVTWGLVTAYTRLTPTDAPAAAAALPPGPARCDDTAPRRAAWPADGGRTTAEAAGTGAATREGLQEGWVTWSVRMGQLASLALPGLDGPVHDAARSSPLALARGATRAMLRRDFPTAARIARWLAWLHAEGVPLPLAPAPLTDHIGLHGGGGRTDLDTAIAHRLLSLKPV
ncbi:hypothetical protein GCM10018785_60450 [Streptomyces longispororuber]|uniref:Uncharacterized protein n=1 Tax=Streptomyces longispororuber TaxID=68230 RepID=A0A919A3Z9_9ACTN|nr:hypothetical protein GCM10018785_60450 [Streptomyces longispororuber]